MLKIAGCFVYLPQDLFGTYLLMLEEKSGGEEAKDCSILVACFPPIRER